MESRDQRDESGSSSERAYFEALKDACRSNDAKKALRSLIGWMGCCCEGQQSPSPRELSGNLGSDDLAEQLAELREAVVSGRDDWSGAALFVAVGQARTQLRDGGST